MLTNTVTPDVAGVVAGEAAPVRGDVTGSINLYVGSGKANSDIYTCPNDSYVEGFIIPQGGSAYSMEVRVNGVDLPYKGSSGDVNTPREIFLSPGDVLASGGTSGTYWGITGLVKKF